VVLWETASVTAKALAALAARAVGCVDCLVREDRGGSLILCEGGDPPRGVQQRRMTPLFSAGRTGSHAGGWVFSVGIWTPADWRSEFCAWYQCEHGPILLECPEWDGFHLLEEPADVGCQFRVLHWLSEPAALESEWRRLSRSTPWFRRLSKNEWFDVAFERVLYRRLPLPH
jgi:hypothetical protein